MLYFSQYLRNRPCDFGLLVNKLITISLKVNILTATRVASLTTGDDHEVQKSDRYPWPLVVAVRPWLERCWRQRLIEFRLISAEFSRIFDDLRLGADRLSAF